MSPSRALGLSVCVFAAAGLAACFGTAPRNEIPKSRTPAPVEVPPVEAPPAPESVPDAVPRVEPRSRNGNPPFYDVMGKRYYVLSSSVGYVERGVASWYGPGFHKVRTSTGEPYDMYAMTAAHKTLPLPAYVRVTNLQNGLSVVVRVNDRGPFVGNRIIDLSYTAASKLGMLRNGTAMVEVRSLEPLPTQSLASAETSAAQAPAPAIPRALFIQAGAFSDPSNARRLAEKLRGSGYDKVFVRDNEISGRRMFRVRIGPVPDVAEFDRIVADMQRFGISDAHLALD
ncbi:MAG TPA: septal ring lytic transglycosylase RlpA family protein [Steroidobacteraceae bacterium]|nr:septal ring lytic transglycosylase RlpA family protein [Steroidobacteraceae bacterium]